MKLLILCNNDLASLLAVNLLISNLAEHDLMIGQSSKVGGNKEQPQALKLLTAFEHSMLNDEKACQQLFSKILGLKESRFLLFENLSNEFAAPIVGLNHINTRDGSAVVTGFAPDLILSIRFGKILQQPVIEIPSLGVLNLHSGSLPAYQGVMATFWAMLNGKEMAASCLHFIENKTIDSGEIIQQSKIALDKKLSYLANVLRLYPRGVNMMVDAVEKLNRDIELESKAQRGKSTYYGFPSEEDLEAFSQLGFKLY